ncbi:ATP-binding cassette domain-containing protein [Streptomyces sp. NPDC087440]|uniref:ATP-binding cassette domain-containing protein n=1 Tax=Streptomyces sp. NPDC087440 TaxID=3365790 RepID=UPI00380035CC
MRLSRVGRRYGLRGDWVLRGVDLELRPGSLVRLQGANGTGKSTLLRILAGIDAPTEGRVEGRPQRVAYVPERFPGGLPLTALGYLVHLGRIHGLGRARAREEARAQLERFGADGHARTPVAELSKGTAQKVAVAQALMAEPELLVLDEAWTGLDEAARSELDRAVAERVAAGARVAFVDHDPRRLAGAVDAAHEVSGLGLRGVNSPAEEAESGPRVRIVVSGPRGAALPAGLPGAPRVVPDADGAMALTVPAVHSDGVLRVLLGSQPPWHIRAVAPDASPAAERQAPEGRAPERSQA